MGKAIVADLHTHTTASDGELSPEELVDRAAAAGLQALAITDHDTMGGIEAAITRARSKGIEIIPGVELTVYEGRIELHILAYFFNHYVAIGFLTLLARIQQHRFGRGLAMAEKLRAAGFAIEDIDVLEAAGDAESLGRVHVGEALVKRGYAKSVKGAIIQFLLEGGAGYVPKYQLTPDQAFAAVKKAGGITLLAHPGLAQHDELIVPLFRRGMDGIEAYHRSHSEANARFYEGLARRYDKVVSGGSDYHGPTVTPKAQVGQAGVTREMLSRLAGAARRNSV